ncbi:MAG: phage tail assembly protein [Acetobacter orientalis]|uniref:phage tail assembly protein n=1 Tax=Acetobacter orientalis TaxID=146474 RepID=UPI0039E7E802
MSTNCLSDADVLSAVAEPEETEEKPDGVFTLDNAITGKDAKHYTELHLREPVVFHILQAAKVIGKRPSLESVYDSQIDMVCRISSWPKVIVDQLPSRVLDQAIAYLNSFEEDARRGEDEEPECPDSLTLTFSPAIDAVDQSFTEMSLHEPVVAQRRRYKATESKGNFADFIQAQINLVAAVSGWPLAAVLKMPISKFAKASDYLTGFFISGRAIGSSSPQS